MVYEALIGRIAFLMCEKYSIPAFLHTLHLFNKILVIHIITRNVQNINGYQTLKKVIVFVNNCRFISIELHIAPHQYATVFFKETTGTSTMCV